MAMKFSRTLAAILAALCVSSAEAQTIKSGHVLGNGTASERTPTDTSLFSVMGQSGSGLGPGIAAALGTAIGSIGAPIISGGALISGHCPQISGSGASITLIDSGAGCGGGGGGSGTVATGTINDLGYYAAGGTTISPLTTIVNGVLVTSSSGGGVPSISTTLPNGLAMGTPASLALTNATGLPTSGLLSGALAAGVTVNNANWSGTPLAIGNLASATITVNGTPCMLGSSCAPTVPASGIAVGTTTVTGGGATNGLLYNNAGVLGNLATANNGVLVTSAGGAPSISSTLPANLSAATAALLSPNITGTPSIVGLPGLTTSVLGSPAAGLDMNGCTTRATCSWYIYSAPTNWTANGNGDMMQISRVNPSTGSGAAGGVYSVISVNGYTGASESSTMYAMPVTVQDNRTSTGSDVAIPVASIMNKNGGAHAEGIYWQQQDNVASTDPTVGVVAEGDVYRARGSTTDTNNVEWALNLNGGSAQCLSTPTNPAPPGPCDATSRAVHIGALLVFSPQNSSTVDVGILFGAGFYGGDYVNGIDFRPGAYFGFPLIGNGFSVNPSGNAVFNALNLNGLGAVSATTHLCITVTKVVGTC